MIEKLAQIFSQSERDGIAVVVCASIFGAFLRLMATVSVSRFRIMMTEFALSLFAALFAGIFAIWLEQGMVALILWSWAGTWSGKLMIDLLVSRFTKGVGAVIKATDPKA